MATIHVDPEWPTTGTGTFEDPYKSWASTTTMTAGNSYLQAEGTTFVGTLGGPLGTGGTAAAPIIIGVYSRVDGSQVSRRGAAAINATGQSFGINITSARPYVIVDGLEIYGATSANITKTAASKSESQYCEFRNLLLHDGIADGLLASGKGNKVIDCHIYGNGQDGARFVGDDLEVSGNHMWGNGTTNVDGDCCQLLNCSNPYVHGNIFDHTASIYKQALIHNRDDGASTGGLFVDNDILCVQYTGGAALKSLFCGVPGAKFSGNRISGGQYGAFLEAADITFASNEVVVSGSSTVVGVALRGTGIDVLGNTVVGGGGDADSIGIDHDNAANTGCTIVGNALLSWPVAIRTDGATYSHNAFDDCTVRNGDAASAEGTAGTGDVVADLGVGPDYRPRASSPLIGAGSHFGYGLDADGNLRWNPPTIGAYEYVRPRDERT
jgi:hypothetical protein